MHVLYIWAGMIGAGVGAYMHFDSVGAGIGVSSVIMWVSVRY